MDTYYTVLVFGTKSGELLRESGELRPHEVPFFLDNDVDLSRHNFRVIEEKTGEYIQKGSSWKYLPDN